MRHKIYISRYAKWLFQNNLHQKNVTCKYAGERVWHSLQENKAIFKEKYFSKFLDLDRNFEKLGVCIKMPAPLSLLTEE